MVKPTDAALVLLTFAYVIVTFLLWRANLRALKQNAELVQANTHMVEEMKHTREAQTRGVFEAAFFQLINLHIQLIDKINLGNGYVDQMAFNELYAKLEGSFNEVKRINPGIQERDVAALAYDDFFKGQQKHVGHYFRSLFNIVKYVDGSALSQADKQKYVNILRARLSSTELLLLFYNALTHRGSNFVPLIYKYSFLEGLPPKKLLAESHEGFYDPPAYNEKHQPQAS